MAPRTYPAIADLQHRLGLDAVRPIQEWLERRMAGCMMRWNRLQEITKPRRCHGARRKQELSNSANMCMSPANHSH